MPPPPGPALIEADADKIVYKITFDLPDAGLIGPAIVPDYNMEPAAHNGNDIHNLAMETVDLLTNDTHQSSGSTAIPITITQECNWE
jgi:hypothetical protein